MAPDELRAAVIAMQPQDEIITLKTSPTTGDMKSWLLLARAAADGLIEGCVIANEFIDAFPVHRVRGTADGELEEAHVTWRNEGFAATQLLRTRLGPGA